MKLVYYGRVPCVRRCIESLYYSVSALYCIVYSVLYRRCILHCILLWNLLWVSVQKKQRTEREDRKGRTGVGSITGAGEHVGVGIIEKWAMPGQKMILDGIGLI